ncbi:keratin-associated protein 2-1-like [Alexandromys fortis]|nr:keratin-associated protein 2-1-like [Microtus fortis]
MGKVTSECALQTFSCHVTSPGRIDCQPVSLGSSALARYIKGPDPEDTSHLRTPICSPLLNPTPAQTPTMSCCGSFSSQSCGGCCQPCCCRDPCCCRPVSCQTTVCRPVTCVPHFTRPICEPCRRPICCDPCSLQQGCCRPITCCPTSCTAVVCRPCCWASTCCQPISVQAPCCRPPCCQPAPCRTTCRTSPCNTCC